MARFSAGHRTGKPCVQRGILHSGRGGKTMLAQDRDAGASTAGATHAIFTPGTDRERDEVRAQLQRILSSPVFLNSKRYAAVLKYIVDQTLEGAGERLKERTIGIEVFQRAPDYDTSTDHAVRSAVAEVRKRRLWTPASGRQLPIARTTATRCCPSLQNDER